MPQLRAPTSKLKHLILPSTATLAEGDQAFVDLDVGSFNTSDILALQAVDQQLLKMQAEILANRIKDWNFTEADGSKTPIDYDAVARLEIEDFQFLITEMNTPDPDAETQKKTLIGN